MAIILTRKGEEILVDEEDFPVLSKHSWYIAKVGYPYTRASGELISMHRMLMGLEAGDRRIVDHKNMVKTDNRRQNLRVCSKSQNQMNSGAHADNKSGFKGVTTHANGRYSARIAVNGNGRHLGMFDTPQAAHEFYCLAADMLHKEFANHGGGI